MFAKEEDLDIFLEECKITYLSSGAYGIVFLVVSETSPYVSRNNKRVNKMIIKLCGINNHHTHPITSIIQGKRYSVKTVTQKSFEREIDIQTEVFFRTCDYLNPVCPCIIHSEVKGADFDEVRRQRLSPRLTHLLDKTLPDSNEYILLKCFLDEITSGRLSMYGLICMEYADGFEPLYKLKRTETQETIDLLQNVARKKLIEMTLKTSYTHSDFHDGNILCKNGPTPDVMIIDFGLSNRLQHEEWDTLRKECNEGRYYDALESIFYPLRYDSYDLRNRMDKYGWLLGSEEDIEYMGEFEEIDISESVKDKINIDLTEIFKLDELKKEEISSFTSLPLTEKERQKFYQFKMEAPPKYIRNQYQIQGPDAIIPQSSRKASLYDKRIHRRTRSLNRGTLKKKKVRTSSRGSREPKIVFTRSRSRNSRNTAVPRGTRR
jgi:hypothetical protein